jgi:hypothetical protein
MKSVFDALPLFAAVGGEPNPPDAAPHDHVFQPLSALAIYENRIAVDASAKPSSKRRFPYRPAGRLVN